MVNVPGFICKVGMTGASGLWSMKIGIPGTSNAIPPVSHRARREPPSCTGFVTSPRTPQQANPPLPRGKMSSRSCPAVDRRPEFSYRLSLAHFIFWDFRKTTTPPDMISAVGYSMRVVETEMAGIKLLKPVRHVDTRVFF